MIILLDLPSGLTEDVAETHPILFIVVRVGRFQPLSLLAAGLGVPYFGLHGFWVDESTQVVRGVAVADVGLLLIGLGRLPRSTDFVPLFQGLRGWPDGTLFKAQKSVMLIELFVLMPGQLLSLLTRQRPVYR